ncbi:MAG: class I SAM-dependent methyltransferase [Bacteroidales bacterium]|nr:class I SAM-dependent methyltransferase [Bacteroidales bacterium]
MTTKEHYDKHLANFYSWMAGDFDNAKNLFKEFCINNKIKPFANKLAIDLGAGNGIQSVALAELGYRVTAIDFNEQLLSELSNKTGNLRIKTINSDIRNLKLFNIQPELIVCCGDTLTHLESITEAKQLIADASEILCLNGKIMLSFRDYSLELEDTQRFIPVKSDATRLLTCVLEYFEDKVRVTDLLNEYDDGQWKQKVSSYLKIRISKETVTKLLENLGLKIKYNQTEKGIINLIAQK